MGVTLICTDPIQTMWAKIFWKGICDADLFLHLRVLCYSAVQPMSHNIEAWGTQHLSWLDGLPSRNSRKLVCDYCTGTRALGMHRWKTICIFWKVEQISSQSLFRPRSSHCRLTNYISRLNPEHAFLYLFHPNLQSQSQAYTVSSEYSFIYHYFPTDCWGANRKPTSRHPS